MNDMVGKAQIALDIAEDRVLAMAANPHCDPRQVIRASNNVVKAYEALATLRAARQMGLDQASWQVLRGTQINSQRVGGQMFDNTASIDEISADIEQKHQANLNMLAALKAKRDKVEAE